MDIRDVLKLLIALAIFLKIRPEDLAAVLADKATIQQYYETIVGLTIKRQT